MTPGEKSAVKFKIIGLGELLWDLLPGGRQLGGAPANFAYHASALGAEARLISRIGVDELGREALDLLTQREVQIECIELDPTLPTGTVGVEIGLDGQPQFQIHQNVAWDALDVDPLAARTIAEADAVCFGSLAQRCDHARAAIQSMVAAAPAEALRIFDINLRQHYYSRRIIEESLALANVLKVNENELPRLAELLGLPPGEQSQIAELAARYELKCLAYTRGGLGSLLYRDGEWSSHPGISTKIVDTVGAGDSFTAAMTLGLLAGWELGHVNEMANRVAAYVCSNAGGMPQLPPELRRCFGPDSIHLPDLAPSH